MSNKLPGPCTIRLLTLPGLRRLATVRGKRAYEPAVRDFLAKTLQTGDLGAAAAGFTITLVNPWIEQDITALEVRLDGRRFDPARLLLDDGRRRRGGDRLTPFRFSVNTPLTVTLRNRFLPDGLHFLEILLTGSSARFHLPPAPLRVTGGVAELSFINEPEPDAEVTHWRSGPAVFHLAPVLWNDLDWLFDEAAVRYLARGHLLEVARQLSNDPTTAAAAAQWPAGEDDDLFARLRNLCAKEQFEPLLGFCTEPAVLFLSGESLVRQTVARQADCRRRFGRPAVTAWLPHRQGLPDSLPQILRKAGCRGLLLHAPLPDSAASHTFAWQGADGTRLNAHCLQTPPDAGFPLPRDPAAVRQKLDAWVEVLAAQAPSNQLFCPAGSVFGHPQEAAAALLAAVNEKHRRVHFQLSRPVDFFAALPDRGLPVVYGELAQTAAPLPAPRPDLLRLHRRAEYAALAMERLPLIAGLAEDESYRRAVGQVWERVLASQGLAALSGAHVAEVHDRLTVQLKTALELAATHGRALLGRLARMIPSPPGAWGVVVVANTLPFWRERTVELELTPPDGRPPTLTDGKRRYPLQILSADRAGNSLQRARGVLSLAVPPLGYRALWLMPPDRCPAPEVERGVVKVDRHFLQNAWLTVTISPQNAALGRIADRHRRRLYEMDDVGLLAWRRPSGRRRFFRAERLDILENGPVRAALRYTGRLDGQAASVTYRLSQGSKIIEVLTTVTLRGRAGRLEVKTPRPVLSHRIVHETPYGLTVRGRGVFPALNFLDIGDDEGGLAVLNDGLAGHGVERKAVWLELAADLPVVHPVHHREGIIPRGGHAFRYAFFPHQLSAAGAHVYRRGLDFNAPYLVHQSPLPAAAARSPLPSSTGAEPDALPDAGLYTPPDELAAAAALFGQDELIDETELPAPAHAPADLSPPRARSLLRLTPDNIEIGAILQHPDGAVVIRLVERAGKDTLALLKPKWPAARLEITDLLGRAVAEIPPPARRARDGFWEIPCRAFEIKTLRFLPPS